MKDGSADLIAAVFCRAMSDGCAPCRDATKLPRELATTKTDALEAWRFLTETAGEWAAHRNWLAGLVNSDGDYIRSEAIKRGPSRAARIAMGERPEAPQDPTSRRQAAVIGSGYPWTEAEKSMLRVMDEAGATRVEMMAATGRSLRGIDGQLRRQRPPPPKAGAHRPWTVRDLATLGAMRARRCSISEIALALGRTGKSIDQKLGALGLTKKQNAKDAA